MMPRIKMESLKCSFRDLTNIARAVPLKKFERDTRGQFVVIVALIIAITTLSLVVTIHNINVNTEQLDYEPVQELVLGITSDLDRALICALSNATEVYNATGSKAEAIDRGTAFISKWVRSMRTSYSHLDIKMSMEMNQTGEGLTDVAWSISWSNVSGISQVYTKFGLDIEAYGFKGWVGLSGKRVTLHIFPDTITLNDDNTTTLTFQVMQGKEEDVPVSNLTPESLLIWANITKTSMIQGNITELIYLGGGNYNVTFTPLLDQYAMGVTVTAITPEDNIMVSAQHNVENVFIVELFSQDEESPIPTNLGAIQLGEGNYTLSPEGNSTQIDPGRHLLRYFAEEGDTFLNWTTTSEIQVDSNGSSITLATIGGNGSITAFYREPHFELSMHSKEEGGEITDLGTIVFNSTEYTLGNSTSIPAGDYPLEYQPPESNYFVRWESNDTIIPWGSNNNSTMLTILGNGTIIAVYNSTQPSMTDSFNVTLQSLRQTTDIPPELGKIQLGATVFEAPWPKSTNLTSGTYFLEYTPELGYAFESWNATANIVIQNPNSSLTSATVNGNGIITAIYRGYNISLSSRHWAYLPPANLGGIELNSTNYAELPENIHVASSDNLLYYHLANSSYVFLFWEQSGDVLVWNFTSQATNVTIFGDGNLTAVYGLDTEPLPPLEDPWDTLYIDAGPSLVPLHLWSLHSSHIPSFASAGEGKQELNVTSPPSPTIYLARYLNITAYLSIDPARNARNVTMEFGYYCDPGYYLLGNGTFPVIPEKGTAAYRMTIDTGADVIIVPEGSVFVLRITVAFSEPPWGNFKLHFGPKTPSSIELF